MSTYLDFAILVCLSYLYKSCLTRRVDNSEDTDIENSQGSLYKFRQYIVPQVHIH